MGIHDDIFLQAMNNEDTGGQTNQHGEIKVGKVLSQEDKGFFIALGGKSEMMLPSSETVGSVSVGDEVEIVDIGMKDGIPQVSQKKALYIKTLEQLQQSLENNTPVMAKIVRVVANREGKNVGYIVSINEVEAFLPFSHIRVPKDESELIGQQFNMVVIKLDRDRVTVSEKIIREQLQKEFFAKFIENYKEGDRISVTVSSIADSFVLVSAENITMFLHITQFDWKYIKNLSDVLKVGDKFEVVIQSIDNAKKSIKVSRKEAIENPSLTFFDTKQIGDNISATVIRFARGLAILETDLGAEMILPVEEMSWISRVSDPKQLLKLGDRVEVRVKEMYGEKQRISVSLRDLLENPWSQAQEKYALRTTHQGSVTSITDFGIFVVFDDGIQGLIRKEDIEWSSEDIDLQKRFKKGDHVTAIVLNIEPGRERLRLGIKQLSKNPFQNFADLHKTGSLVSGVVTNIDKDGVDLEIDNGLVAFIHISQLSTEMVHDVNSICKIGDTVQAAVRRVNVAQQTIELSIKDALRREEQKTLDQIINVHTQEIPTLGSILGEALNKKKSN